MPSPLKDLYNTNYINLLSNTMTTHYKNFDKHHFIALIFDASWRDKELKQRMRHISTTLYLVLPKEYNKAISILKNVFLDMNHKYSLENMIFQDFVEVYGLDSFEISMDALSCFTKNSSSEFAIRKFIVKYPTKTISQLKLWATSEDEHIRRLASEGCRPRLPWATSLQEFIKNPNDILPILNMLKNDTSLYVKKSVANNLNDISKDNPMILKNIAKKWIGKSQHTDWILKHGCRSMLKNADEDILKIFGFSKNNNISIRDFKADKNIQIGEKLNFSFLLDCNSLLGKLRIEYAITFIRLNNKYSKKIFKISEGIYKQKSKTITKYYSFRAISTRKYYTGVHKISIVVNGVLLKQKEFMLS